jgi:hypothetical protein
MSGDTGQMAAFGPSPISVHDDGHVFRELFGVELAEDLSFGVAQP